MTLRTFARLPAALMLILLAACGGGSSPGSAPPMLAAAASTVNGTATFSGARNNYTVTSTGTGWTVTDHVGSDGTSNLPSTTATLAFTDFTVNLGIGAKSQTLSASDLKTITELYVAFFNRVPDADGLSYWIDQFKNGMTISQMCDSFYAAAVYYSNLTGYSSGMSNADFITVIYKNVLGRTSVDASGMQYWGTALASGAATRGTLVQAILSSAHSFKGDATWGWVADLLDNKYAVASYFAVQQGLNYSSSSLSITNTIAIAGAVTSTDTAAAIAKIGVSHSSFTTVPTQSITFYIVDGSVAGISYACAPSGKQGVTDFQGKVVCSSGDVGTLTIQTTGGAINLGQVGVPSMSGIALPVTVLTNGMQIAEILQTLNHGTQANMDVSGVSVPQATVAEINAYIAGAGTLPAGQASDDQFLAGIQSQEPGVNFTTPVTGTGTTFRDNTVLPNLMNGIVGISATNPAPVLVGGTTKLTGTIVVAGHGVMPGCNATVDLSGGGILNAVVSGDIQTVGDHAVVWSSPGFLETATVVVPPCNGAPGYQQTTTANVPPFNGNGVIQVTAGFGGNNLLIPVAAAGAGCIADPGTGIDVGGSNPLITVATVVHCDWFTATMTAKLVGGW